MRSFLVIFNNITISFTEICSSNLSPLELIPFYEGPPRSPTIPISSLNFPIFVTIEETCPDPLCTRNTGDIGIHYKASFKRWREKWHLAGCGGEGRRIKASIGVREVRYGRAREKKEIAERQVGRRRPPRRRRRRRRKSAHGPRHRHGPSSSWRVLLLVDVAPVSRNSWWTSSWACNAGRRQGGG